MSFWHFDISDLKQADISTLITIFVRNKHCEVWTNMSVRPECHFLLKDVTRNAVVCVFMVGIAQAPGKLWFIAYFLPTVYWSLPQLSGSSAFCAVVYRSFSEPLFTEVRSLRDCIQFKRLQFIEMVNVKEWLGGSSKLSV